MRPSVTGRLTFLLVSVTLVTAAPIQAQSGGGSAPCVQFAADFAALEQQIGSVMGMPSSCPRIEANGDIFQATSTGLAVHRPDGMSIFASGDEHWALSADGLEQWTGNWHNGLYPVATPEPEAEAASPAPETQASVQPMRLVRVIQDGTNTVVVEDPSGSMFTVETANGCPDVDAAVGDHVFVRSGGSQTDLILLQQHETCAVAAMHTAPGE
jgi:hypothetical protein